MRYFARLGWIAIPWEERNDPNPTGTLFREYYLIEADSFASATRKSNHILSVAENESGSGVLNDLRVSFRQLGILDLEPITSEIVSGADIFDESEAGVSLADARRLILSETARTARERYEQEHGLPPVFPVMWGDEFDGL